MRGKKVCYPLNATLTFLRVTYRYPCPLIRVHRPIIGSFIHCPRTGFLAATIRSSTYRHCDRTGLDATLEFPRGAAHLARLDRALGPRRRRAGARGHPRRASRALCVRFILALISSPQLLTAGQAHLQHYTEPSAEPLPATSSALQGTILPLGQGTFTHNTAGVPIIVACTKADLIDDNTDLVGAGASGMGGMVKGKGDEWEERTDGIMQILRTICLKCACAPHLRLFHSS
jgi:hypothetical protein